MFPPGINKVNLILMFSIKVLHNGPLSSSSKPGASITHNSTQQLTVGRRIVCVMLVVINVDFTPMKKRSRQQKSAKLTSV